MPQFFQKPQSYRSGSAVKIKNGLSALQFCVFRSLVIQLHHLLRVYLIEGLRAYLESEASPVISYQFISDGRLAGCDAALVSVYYSH